MPSFDSHKQNDDIKQALQLSDRAQVKKDLAKIAPSRITESRCHVCVHPFRDWIELMLVRGLHYKTLADRVSPEVSRKSISNHHKEHMDLQDTAFRMLLEQEAQLQGLTEAEGVADIITNRGLLEVSVRQAFNDILNGVTTVEARDMTQMIKLLNDMDSRQQEFGLSEVRAQMQIFIQAIRDVCDQDTQNRIGERVGQLRRREQIPSAYEQLIAGPVVDADVVESIPF